MRIKIPKKLADRNIDEYISRIYFNHKKNPQDQYFFDFTDVEYIGNQELLILSGLFKCFYISNIDFRLEFIKEGVPTTKIHPRIKKQIIQIWEVWKMWRIVPIENRSRYFGIDGNIVERFQKELKYFPKLFEIYTRHGVTPFISLDLINNYRESDIQNLISPIYKLNSVIEDLLDESNCYHPFTSSLLSTIITEELYLNFLEHSLESSFSNLEQCAFMSISFHPKLDEDKNSENDIQKIKALNFKSECLDETIKFFYNKRIKKYKNIPYIEFSFLDFGQGIVNTLKEQYGKSNPQDSDVLRFAFNYNSSRHPIYKNKGKLEQLIPRGLFDILTLVRRYGGLLIVRSNHGKILFDFSNEQDVNKAFSYFGNKKFYFPGTLISLYIPAIEDAKKLNASSIKPEVTFSKIKPDNKKYVNINSIAQKLDVPKDAVYGTLLFELKKEICNNRNHSLVFVSFKGCELERSIVKKTIFFLLSDYDINHRNNVVILNSPTGNIVEEIASEILSMNYAIKNYKLHPLPIIDFNANNELNITWLGIYNDEDKEKLNDLLYEQYSISKVDFKDPANVSGHLNDFDSFGNLISNFPSRDDIITFYKLENDILYSKQVEDLLYKHQSLKKDNNKSLYLCNGNYYQKEYIELNNLLNDKNDCNSIALLLYEKIKLVVEDFKNYKFLGTTTTSHKILKALEFQKLISKDDYCHIDTYHSLESDLSEEKIDSSKKYILICDIISTGYLTRKINSKLQKLGTGIEYIGVIVSILDVEFSDTKIFLQEFSGKTINLYTHPIKKFHREDIGDEVIKKNIVRVNPHTNIPISLSIIDTNYEESIIFPSTISHSKKNNEIVIRNDFLKAIKPESIHIGFLRFNNLVHPYFFNTELILKEVTEELLSAIFKKINKPYLQKRKIKVFYPRKSGIVDFNFGLLKKVLKNYSIEEIEIERFVTPEGWRFPHNTDYLNIKIENSVCVILDDGSCSGDSLIQMIDEISFYNAKEILLLCFIGRVNDHKREFFSRLSDIRVKNKKKIPLSIYFVSHWHIPTYYLDENPNIQETGWLNSIINIPNTPQSIKAIARTVLRAITPKQRDVDFRDYKYLPKAFDDEIPKENLLLVREELGKVIGYRLYKESFTFFDYFLKKHVSKGRKKDKYKELELLCGCFIYEPYLYGKIISVLPDVVERIEEFVRLLIFSDQQIYLDLTYRWDKKDIIHLFFIVFKNDKLINELSIEKFISLARFTLPKESALDYVLYKLLSYFPLSNAEIKLKKYSSEIKKLLLDVSDNETLSITANAKLKIYRWFISSLPSSNTFKDLQSKLKSNYERIVDQKYHDDNIYNDKQIISSTLLDIGNKFRKGLSYENEIVVVKSHWENIALFVEDLLSFSRGFPQFFIDEKILFELESKENSLRKIYGELTEAIYKEDITPEIGKKLNEIFALFILDESHALKIFTRPNSKNALQTIKNFLKNVSESYLRNIIKVPEFKNITLDFPQYFLEIILRELFNNLRHISKDKDLKIYISITRNKVLKIKIWNFLNEDDFGTGGNSGMKTLNNLNNHYLQSYYKRYARNLNHLQVIKIKIL